VSILHGDAGQRAYKRKLFKRRCAWGIGLSIGFIVLVVLTVTAFHYYLQWTEPQGSSAWGAPSAAAAPTRMAKDQLKMSGDVPPDMAVLMKPDLNPCDDFYQYACGGFLETTALKPDQLSFANSWDGVQHNNTARLLPFLEKSDNAAGVFYKSCMNQTAIEEVGTAPLSPFIKQVSEIKDLDSLEAVIFWWHKANVVVFYDWSVESNPDQPEESALYLMQGGITLPSTDFYLSRSSAMQVKREGYKKVARLVLAEVCKLWKGCDMDHWPADAAQRALNVETELARRFASPSEQVGLRTTLRC
jgi:predicted metalloendopeptidase